MTNPFILLVDDDDSIRMLVRMVLEGQGLTVLDASGIGEARSTFEREGSRIRLLITDVQLSDGSGVDLARELCGNDPELRVLIISGGGYGAKGEVEWQVLPKPFSLEDLTQKVRISLALPLQSPERSGELGR